LNVSSKHNEKTKPNDAALHIAKLQANISPAVQLLTTHGLYNQLKTIEDVKIFMQYHAFAVWDFMSLVKSIQQYYAPTSVPWQAPEHNEITRFINEIVLAEESDLDVHGNYRSHYEMYIDAMTDIGANTTPILSFITTLKNGTSIHQAIGEANIPQALKDFLQFTFDTIDTGQIHRIAAAFTFGREDIIPEMFQQVINNSGKEAEIPSFTYYLQRHIELDGDHHGPMALKMMAAACGSDKQKWNEAAETAINALNQRNQLWTMIETELAQSTTQSSTT
jgi:hypothetical protein